MYVAYEGQNIECSQTFVAEDGTPASLKLGYPKCKLWLEQQLLATVYPYAHDPAWLVQVVIPELGNTDPQTLHLKWVAKDVAGNRYQVTEVILVQPSNVPKVGDIVLLEREPTLKFVLPFALTPEQEVHGIVYRNNELVATLDLPAEVREPFLSYTVLTVPKPELRAQLEPYLMLVEYLNYKYELQKTMFNLWVITPQLLNCRNALEASLNKAKLQNVLPQLEYTTSDLMLYLQRGLNLFNGYSPNLTSFDGTNMQGGNFDALVLCASYFALGAQLLAEGMLAFDFSGQAVTLTVDRTPALEAALGRVESAIQDRIPKFKQMLLRRGVSGGTGADAVGSSVGFGHVVLSNAPTTSMNVFRSGWFNR